MTKAKDAAALRLAPLDTPTDLRPNAVPEIFDTRVGTSGKSIPGHCCVAASVSRCASAMAGVPG